MFVIKTKDAKEAFELAAKGVGDVKLIPATSYVNLTVEEGVLYITSTDGTNFLTVECPVEGGEESMECTVKAESLLKLPPRTTVEKMKFTLKGDYLEVVGNGSYKVPTLEGGNFPEAVLNELTLLLEIDSSELKKNFAAAKSAVATDLVMPCLSGYLASSDKIVTTDSVKMSIIKLPFLAGEVNRLIAPKTVELLSVLKGSVRILEDQTGTLLLRDDRCSITSPQLAGVEDYPPVTGILEMVLEKSFKLNRLGTLAALDRVMLFVDPYTNYAVKLVCAGGKATLQDLKGNSLEELEVTEAEDFELRLNTKFFEELLGTLSGEVITVQYSEGSPIKIVEGNFTLILCQVDKE